MLEALSTVFSTLATLPMLICIFGGLIIGLVFGIIPGLNALIAIPLFLPFIFGMDPMLGVAFLLSMAATTNNGGIITACLLGIPGTEQNIASLDDAYAITKAGKAYKGLGIALVSGGLGGVFGGVFLLLLIPVMRRIALLFASPECLVLILVGVLMISILSGDNKVKGLISGCLGLLLSLVGMSAVTGEPRFVFNNANLLDGIKIVPVALGLFALTEIIAFFLRKEGEASPPPLSQLNISPLSVTKAGLEAIFRHPLLFIRSSLLGILFGVIPAFGGAAASFLLYAFAKRTSKNPELFGKGAEEGIIGPESGNNAKDAGGVIPTLAFGIPGTLIMALFLGVFIVLGINPGPAMFREDLDIVMLFPILIILTNALAAIMLIILSGFFIRFVYIKKGILPAVLLVTCTCGVFLVRGVWFDIALFYFFGVLGYLMKRYNYNRAPLILGFVLGAMSERYLFLTLKAYGTAFLARPIVIIILVLSFIYILSNQISITKVIKQVRRTVKKIWA